MTLRPRLKALPRRLARKLKGPTPTEARLQLAASSKLLPQSVIVYTTHKCASTFIPKLFSLIETHGAFAMFDYASEINRSAARLGVVGGYEPFLSSSYSHLYRQHGEIYAPQRRPLDFPGREDLDHIFFLRDPRDVLVSAFYSFGFSHALPNDVKNRELPLRNPQVAPAATMSRWVAGVRRTAF